MKGIAMFALLGAALLAGRAGVSGQEKKDEAREIGKRLLEQRVLLGRALGLLEKEYAAGRRTWRELLPVSKRLLQVELQLSDKRDDRVAALTRHLRLLQRSEEITRNLRDAGRVTEVEYLLARSERLAAEVELLRAGGKVPK